MAGKKGGNVIGFDPLAWMKQPEAPVMEGATAPPAVAVSTAPAESAVSPATVPDQVVIALHDSLTIEHAAALHGELSRHLSAHDIVLDAAQVRRIDTAGVQLLVAFVCQAQQRGAAVSWRSTPPVLHEAWRRLGMESAQPLA
jgi:anti-anti-sigma regulatory factor